MKKNLLVGFILICLANLFSCSPDDGAVTTKEYPTIRIEPVVSGDLSKCNVVLLPSENTVYFRYAVGKEEDRSAFENGTMSGILEKEGNESLEVTFEGVSTLDDLTVFAQAFNENGAGPVASVRPYPVNVKFNVSLQYVTHSSIGISFDLSGAYRKCRYYLGTVEDREDFLKGNIKSTQLEGIQYWVENIFGLEPSKDYILYLKGEDRAGIETPVIEIPVRTYAEEECPSIDFDIKMLDVMGGRFEFVPNDKCGRIVISYESSFGQHDALLHSAGNFCGDLMNMLAGWSEAGINDWCKTGENDCSLEVEMNYSTMLPDSPMEFYVLVYDKEYKPFGCYYYQFKTPKGDDNAPLAQVAIEISEITAHGATYTYTADENTVLFYYETVDADWFDEFQENPSYHEYYLHEFLMNGNGYLARGEKNVVYEEKNAEPGKRYYVVACAMNKNGISGGWSPLVMESYTTLAEE